ncbi:MAG: patatin-like phospholipase family protein [Deltaproteobacteria bacterium]|uniref:Patatin-like phospholipase family protein n=1 Tax=Candidatus Zymogenus saltonus TaxID=2844893 RepID=A0A9D8KFE2_9DELT|nr:patatin-like phospholipase family protein [Candidatus Zymogenus saltonus]
MDPFKKNVAISIDGGGIRGIIATKALWMLEDYLKKTGYIKNTLNEKVHLFAGTSTGAIIAAALAAGIPARDLTRFYRNLGRDVFKKFFPGSAFLRMVVTGEHYSNKKLESLLNTILSKKIGHGTNMNYFFSLNPPIDVVFTTFDITSNRTRYIKPWNAPEMKPDTDENFTPDENFTEWPVVKAVLASSAAPTYFPFIEGEHGLYMDGGVGSYNNPCFLAAYEIYVYLQCIWGWKPEKTTLISLGTGDEPPIFTKKSKNKKLLFKMFDLVFGAFMQSAAKQQVFLVNSFFEALDFRRFQVNLKKKVDLDDASEIDDLEKYGEEMGEKILGNKPEEIGRIYEGFEVSFKCPIVTSRKRIPKRK